MKRFIRHHYFLIRETLKHVFGCYRHLRVTGPLLETCHVAWAKNDFRNYQIFRIGQFTLYRDTMRNFYYNGKQDI